MLSRLVQFSELVLIPKADENAETIEVPLTQARDAELVGKPRFKEDRELWLVVFEGAIDQEQVVVHVTFSQGADGQYIEDVEDISIPSGFDVHGMPQFRIE